MFTSILKTFELVAPKSSANLTLVDQDNIINGVGSDNKVVEAKAKSTSKKNENRKIAKSKLFIKPYHDFLLTESFGSGFFKPKANLVFTKLR